ncbi:MAG: ExbD/TolR family protein [bacterium]
MKLQDYRQQKKPQLMIIPMIDIMFFLLVFFMISMLSMVEQKGIIVNLPQAAAKEQQMTQNVVVTITAENEVYFNKEKMPLDLLVRRLKAEQLDKNQLAVIINADKKAVHGQVVKVLDNLKSNGINKMAIATD